MSKRKSAATRRANQLATSHEAAALGKQREREERRRRTFVVGGVIVAVLTLVLGIGYAVQATRDTTGQVSAAPAGTVAEYGLPRGVSQTAAPVTVAVYEDFMCPFCAQFEAASRDTLEKYVESGRVTVDYNIVAWLDRASDGSDYSTRSMNAVGVVLDTAGVDAAVRLHDLLYDKQPQEGTKGLTDDELISLAVQAGATKADVAAPIRDRKFEQWTVNASEAASKNGVRQTPTVFVDGKMVDFTTIDELVAKIDAAVQEAP